MKILFITNLPSPYRVDFFNELGKQADLTVCYERERSSERNENWVNTAKRNYTETFIHARKLGTDKSIGFGIINALRQEQFDHVIITGYSSPSVMLGILYCQFAGIPFLMEDDGGLYRGREEKHRLLKALLLRKVKAYFTTTDENIQTLADLGVPKDKILKYPFSSVKDGDIQDGMLKSQEKASIRNELGIGEKKIILTVGQFIHRKGFDLLLRAFAGFSQECGLYFVGGEPTKEYLQLVDELHISNVHFIGFKSKEELKNYYAAADLFVLPTREDIWGLVINEAMAAGLPIITTNRCGAGLELIKNGENGFLVQVGDREALREKMMLILNDSQRQKSMSQKAFDVINGYSIEKMAAWHIQALEKL